MTEHCHLSLYSNSPSLYQLVESACGFLSLLLSFNSHRTLFLQAHKFAYAPKIQILNACQSYFYTVG